MKLPKNKLFHVYRSELHWDESYDVTVHQIQPKLWNTNFKLNWNLTPWNQFNFNFFKQIFEGLLNGKWMLYIGIFGTLIQTRKTTYLMLVKQVKEASFVRIWFRAFTFFVWIVVKYVTSNQHQALIYYKVKSLRRFLTKWY